MVLYMGLYIHPFHHCSLRMFFKLLNSALSHCAVILYSLRRRVGCCAERAQKPWGSGHSQSSELPAAVYCQTAPSESLTVVCRFPLFFLSVSNLHFDRCLLKMFIPKNTHENSTATQKSQQYLQFLENTIHK